MTYTPEQARHDYRPLIKRGEVMELGRRLGITATTMRLMIEGEDAPIKRQTFAGQQRGYFKLEDVLGQIAPATPRSTNAKA